MWEATGEDIFFKSSTKILIKIRLTMVSMFHIYIALVVFNVSTVTRANERLKRYVSLILDVHDYYRTSSVFFISSRKNHHAYNIGQSGRRFRRTMLQQEIYDYKLGRVLTREFSRKGVMTLIINSNEIEESMNRYKKRVIRPLVVVIMKSADDVDDFYDNTRNVNISYPLWLMIYENEIDRSVCERCEKPMRNTLSLRYDTEMLVVCCGNQIITEWWAIGENKTEMAIFGQWSIDGGLKFPIKDSLYARRHEVNGTGLRVGIVTNSAFLTDEGDKIGGFYGNIFMELTRVMNFKITKILRKDGFGSWNSLTESWSGVIGEIARGEVDFGVAEFTITNHRLDVVDFTVPFISTRTQLYVRELDASGVQWSAYFEAFTGEIWLTIVFLMISTTVSVALIKSRTKPNLFAHLVLEHHLQVWGIFCQQGLTEFPVETPLRIAYFSIFVSSLVVSAAYSASLISFLTVSPTALPFTTMEGFVNDGSYGLIVLQNSSDYDLFSTATDSVMSEMNTLMKPWNLLPENLEEGFEQVCAEKVVFHANEAMVKTMNTRLPCKVAGIETGRVDSMAMIMPAKSQYTAVVNYHIQRFKDNGMMHRLQKQYLLMPGSTEPTHDIVSLWGVVPILAVLAGGIILALVVLFCEKSYKTFGKMARTRRKVNSEMIYSRRSEKHRWLDDQVKDQKSQQHLPSHFARWTEHFKGSQPLK